MLRFALFEDGPAVSLSASHRHPRRTTASAPFARPSLFYAPHSPPSVYAAKRVSVSTFFRKNLHESITPTTISPTTTTRSTDSIFIFEKPLPRFRRKFPLEFYVTKIMARLNRTRRAIPRAGIAKRTRMGRKCILPTRLATRSPRLKIPFDSSFLKGKRGMSFATRIPLE